MSDQKNLTDSLNELEAIVGWFDEQEEVDVEQGLSKVRDAAALIKTSKARLAEIENEFHEIEKEIGENDDDSHEGRDQPDDKPINLNEIPF